MQDKDLEIVPGERIGPYYLAWDLETLKKHLPKYYLVREGSHAWEIEFDEFFIRVIKIDNRIDSIAVCDNFKQHFKQINSKSTLEQVKNEVGPVELFSDITTLTKYPRIQLYFDDEDENDESDDSWRNIKVKTIGIYDPNFIWDEHYSHKDYEDMKNNKFGCPFPKEKLL